MSSAVTTFTPQAKYSCPFRQTVENNITNHLISHASAITPEDLDDLRKFCVYQVKETNGEITLKDALKHQKRLL